MPYSPMYEEQFSNLVNDEIKRITFSNAEDFMKFCNSMAHLVDTEGNPQIATEYKDTINAFKELIDDGFDFYVTDAIVDKINIIQIGLNRDSPKQEIPAFIPVESQEDKSSPAELRQKRIEQARAEFKLLVIKCIKEKLNEFSKMTYDERTNYIIQQQQQRVEAKKVQQQLADHKVPVPGDSSHVITDAEELALNALILQIAQVNRGPGLFPSVAIRTPQQLLEQAERCPVIAATILLNEGLRNRLLQGSDDERAEKLQRIARRCFESAQLILENEILRSQLLQGSEEAKAKRLEIIAKSDPASARLILENETLRNQFLPGSEDERAETLRWRARNIKFLGPIILGSETLRNQLLQGSEEDIAKRLTAMAGFNTDSALLILRDETLRHHLLQGGSEKLKAERLLWIATQRYELGPFILENEALRHLLLQGSEDEKARRLQEMAKGFDSARLILENEVLRSQLLQGSDEAKAEKLLEIAVSGIIFARLILENDSLRTLLLVGTIAEKLDRLQKVTRRIENFFYVNPDGVAIIKRICKQIRTELQPPAAPPAPRLG